MRKSGSVSAFYPRTGWLLPSRYVIALVGPYLGAPHLKSGSSFGALTQLGAADSLRARCTNAPLWTPAVLAIRYPSREALNNAEQHFGAAPEPLGFDPAGRRV